MRLLPLLLLALPVCAGAEQNWTCHLRDGAKVFQDHPCDEPGPGHEGVVHAPAPRADDPNPGWCTAHKAWRDDAKAKGASAEDKNVAAGWSAKEQENERWLKVHHCQ
ncbi:MAG: hypothetical protein P4L83_02745 [Nevskia sp.]|nr:hypothetical protein [Nevskia sp.]